MGCNAIHFHVDYGYKNESSLDNFLQWIGWDVLECQKDGLAVGNFDDLAMKESVTESREIWYWRCVF